MRVVADEASYVRQVSLHAAAALRVATALVGHDDAEYAAQEALTRAWRAWGTLRDTSAARSWLLRITVNVCREWLRGSMGTSRRMVQPLPDDTQAVGPVPREDVGVHRKCRLEFGELQRLAHAEQFDTMPKYI